MTFKAKIHSDIYTVNFSDFYGNKKKKSYIMRRGETLECVTNPISSVSDSLRLTFDCIATGLRVVFCKGLKN